MRDELLLLSEEDIRGLLAPGDVVAAVEGVFRSCAGGNALCAPPGRLETDPEGRNFFMAFPSGLRDLGVAGVKWFSGYAAPQAGFPFSHGNMLLLADMGTGGPFALMGAGTITAMRTGGGHCVAAAKHLARPKPETLCVIGSGAQARAGVRGFLAQFPTLRTLRLWSLPDSRQVAMAADFGERLRVVLCDTPEEAVRGADIVLTATTSPDVLVRAEWIAPGTTVVAVTAFVDLDPALAERADKWVLGNHEEDGRHIIDAGNLRHGYPLDKSMVWADMSEIVTGERPGREREEEIIVYTHMGMGAFDIACGKLAYDRAVQRNVGHRFLLEEF